MTGTNDTREHIEVPYLVVGAGPVGLTAARLLSNAGRSSLVVERRGGPQSSPAAHVVNARSLEVFRQAGLDMDAIAAIAKDPAETGHVNFVTHLGGDLIGRLPFEQQGDDCLAHTPTPLRNISQHRLEPILAADARAAAGVDLRYGVEWTSATQDDAGVTSVLRDLSDGREIVVRSSYLLAADGAGSPVRRSLGIEMVGPASIQSFVAVHLLADLRPVVGEHRGVLHFVMDPGAAGTFIAHDPAREWVFMVGIDPQTQSADDMDIDRCAELVRAAMGGADVPIDIVGRSTWHMTAQVAERMRDGRILLLGDAAHRFPPTGGMGLNTGVADAHNLVWKLGAVEDGWAAAGLLDTYATERLPVAHTNCEQSTTNAFKIVLLVDALGLSRTSDSDALHAALADPARRDTIDAAVQEQATHFDMLGLQLGYVYLDGALARDGEAPPPMTDPRRLDLHGEIGARLPHGWLADGRSTLDLVHPDRLSLLSVGDHDRWAAACAAATVPVVHVPLVGDDAVTTEWLARCGLGAGAALLVRPDQHVAWRAEVCPVDPEASLVVGIDRVLDTEVR